MGEDEEMVGTIYGLTQDRIYMADNGDIFIKVVVIGGIMVGKHAFVQRYVNRTFRSGYRTPSVDFALKTIPLTDNIQIKLQLWNIPGGEIFGSMTRVYYKDAKACILMFDLTNAVSFQKVTKWKQDFDSKARMPDGSLLPCLLVANKVDRSGERQVEQAEIAKVCEDLGFAGWMETSAKEDIMVDESFKFILDVVTRNDKLECCTSASKLGQTRQETDHEEIEMQPLGLGQGTHN